MSRIKEIIIPDAIAPGYETNTSFKTLRCIKRLNAFVGPNNSGKSRLLRELFLTGPNLMVSTENQFASKVRQQVDAILFEFSSKSCAVAIPSDLENWINNSYLGFHQLSAHSVPHNALKTKSKETASHASQIRFDHSNAAAQLDKLAETLNRWSRETESDPAMQETGSVPLSAATFVYIPTLRGMRLGIDDQDLKFAYFDRTWNDYVKGRTEAGRLIAKTSDRARENLSGTQIVTGLDFYDVLTNRLLGDLTDREFIRSYQDYLSTTFFQGVPVALIPRRDHDTVNIKIGREAERPVQSLGDGLQQIIIITLPLFQHSDVPLFLFIEEPDLFLHPGYQRVLIDAITADRDRELYVFVTTHSNHFLDITIPDTDSAVFRFSKLPPTKKDSEHDPRFLVTNVSAGDFEVLKDIGVRPSSVMLSNCTIWVEGITDRRYIRRFVELYFKAKRRYVIENLHYSFVEYGGSNITHWSFLDEEDGIAVDRLCAELILIADQDKGKEIRHQRLADKLGDRFLKLPVKEVENLLTPDVIRKVILTYEGETFPLAEFKQSQFANRYLGRFIDTKVLINKSNSKRFGRLKTCYADKSGTIKNKVEFCNRALLHLTDYESLSQDAKEVTEQICRFIVEQNPALEPNC